MIEDIRFNTDFEGVNFDNVEVHPCREVAPGMYDQCEPHEADIWGVFIHMPEMGLECIADCKTETLASQFAEIILMAGRQFLREDFI